MLLNRPRGNIAETPTCLRQRLQRSWTARVKDHLSPTCEDENTWPLEVSIGAPRLAGEAMLRNIRTIKPWIEAWQDVAPGLDVRFSELSRRQIGKVSIPDRIVFQDIDRLADFLGKDASEELETARARFADLKAIDPRLMGMAPNWRGITEMSPEEHSGACEFLSERQYDPEEIISIREKMISGLDGKFLEKRRSILESALAHMQKLKESPDFRQRLGFRNDDRQTLWIKANPADMTGPFGTRQFAVRPTELRDIPASIRRVAIVENVETFFSHDPDPGVLLFFGGGNAIAGMASEIPALQTLDTVYWGDLDSFGMKILSRLRRVVPHLRSALMDGATMTGIARDAWRKEPESDRYSGSIDGLTLAEQDALDLIRAGNYRIEQEHLRPAPEMLAALGLHRATCAA